METLNVTVTRVLFPREPFNDGRERFCSFLTSAGKCAGVLAFFPKDGMRLKLYGDWGAFRGERQFQFKRVMHDFPEDKRALLDYAVSLTKGMGEAAANAIWSAHGSGWEAHVGELRPSWANGLSRTMNALMANAERLALIQYMLHIGGTPKMAEAAYLRWKGNAAATIEQNPYVLSTLPGIGFKTVDGRIREHFKITDADMRRAVAAIDYAVTAMMDESGNTIIDRSALYREIDDLRLPRNAAALAIAKLTAQKRIVFVGSDRLTAAEVVRSETDIARYASLAVWASFEDVIYPEGFKPDESQRRAASAAVGSQGLCVINGGAGCGKTTIIRAIANTLKARGYQVSLCAFAGKAAARLREATGHSATTIHSMLQWSGEGYGFTAGNLHGVSVILDEASMVPSSLLYEITKRNPERLILVGDQAQLQPVGIGSPFHDIIDKLPTLVYTLTNCYRNKEAVFSAAAKVRNGDVPHGAKSRKEEFAVRRLDSVAAIHDWIAQHVRAGEIDFAQDLVLSPRNGEGETPAPATVKSLNETLQGIANPHVEGEKFKVDDRVMFTKNWSEKDLWNGTTGRISRVDCDGVPYFTSDDGDETRIADKEKRQYIVPAYCLTVHKAQGSQYRNVYVVCARRDEARLFDRSMLYTAITRARRGCTLLCDDGLDRIVNTVRRRATYLQCVLDGKAD